jgi:soluble lytic murein transglycosylase
VSDPVYNTQMGAGGVTALLKEYAGSYIMTFAGYNAGRGRVRQWVAQHTIRAMPRSTRSIGLERIPLAETRNYVQPVMENLQIYHERFGDISATIETQPASYGDGRVAPGARAPSCLEQLL